MFPVTDVMIVCYDTVFFSPEREPYLTGTLTHPHNRLQCKLQTSFALEESLNATDR
jgi:hypothetical protein